MKKRKNRRPVFSRLHGGVRSPEPLHEACTAVFFKTKTLAQAAREQEMDEDIFEIVYERVADVYRPLIDTFATDPRLLAILTMREPDGQTSERIQRLEAMAAEWQRGIHPGTVRRMVAEAANEALREILDVEDELDAR